MGASCTLFFREEEDNLATGPSGGNSSGFNLQTFKCLEKTCAGLLNFLACHEEVLEGTIRIPARARP
jgi:hypothetical protein